MSRLQGARLSSKPFEGLDIDGDADVRVVLEDNTHRVHLSSVDARRRHMPGANGYEAADGAFEREQCHGARR
jgi:hypothetical protein